MSSLYALRYMYNTNLSLSLSCAQVKSPSSTERMISLKAGGHKQHAKSVENIQISMSL